MLPAECLQNPLEITRVDAPEAGAVSDIDDRAAGAGIGRLVVAEEFRGTIENLDQIGRAERRPCIESGERPLHAGVPNRNEALAQRHACHVCRGGEVAVGRSGGLQHAGQGVPATPAEVSHLACGCVDDHEYAGRRSLPGRRRPPHANGRNGDGRLIPTEALDKRNPHRGWRRGGRAFAVGGECSRRHCERGQNDLNPHEVGPLQQREAKREGHASARVATGERTRCHGILRTFAVTLRCELSL